MALSASTVWEVRTTGADTNGGGFVSGGSGTDYSQQDAAQYSATDLAVDGATNTKVTSASHSFTAADVDNVMQITAGTGWTTGFYRIVSVASGAATLDRSPGATGITGGTFAVGGALATIAKAAGAVVAGNTTYIKSGTYTLTSTTTLSTSGSAGNPVSWIGYSSARGDGGRPVITSATNSVHLVTFAANLSNQAFYNLQLTHTAATRGRGISASTTGGTHTGVHLQNCILDGLSTGIMADTSVTNAIVSLVVIGCEFKNCTADGVANSGGGHFYGCAFHGNTTDGLTNGASAGGDTPRFTLIRCVLSGNGGRGLNIKTSSTINTPGYPVEVIHCVVSGNTSDGIRSVQTSAATGYQLVLVNNIIQGNGGWGVIVASTPIGVYNACNAYRANTSGNLSGLSAGAGDVTLTGDPFTNAAGADYSLNSTAGAGAACRGAGTPGALVYGGTGYADIGALQHQDSGGGVTVLAGDGGLAG